MYSKILFIAVLVGLVVVSLIMYQNLNNYIIENRMLGHSKEIITMAELVLSSVKDAETGQRGFLLTHDSTFLQPYQTAMALVPGQLTTLDSLVRNNNTQMENVSSLKELIKNRFATMEIVLSRIDQNTRGLNNYQRNLMDQGKGHMDAIRAEIREMLDEEDRQIVQLKDDRENIFQTSAPIALFTFTLIRRGHAPVH